MWNQALSIRISPKASTQKSSPAEAKTPYAAKAARRTATDASTESRAPPPWAQAAVQATATTPEAAWTDRRVLRDGFAPRITARAPKTINPEIKATLRTRRTESRSNPKTPRLRMKDSGSLRMRSLAMSRSRKPNPFDTQNGRFSALGNCRRAFMAGLYRGCAGAPALSLRQVKQIEAGSQVCNYTAGAGRAPRESTGNQPICGNSKRAVEYGSLNTIVGYEFEQGFWQRGRRSAQVEQERARSGATLPMAGPARAA